MKKVYILLIISVLFIAKKSFALDAEILPAVFWSSQKAYLEINLEVLGTTVGQTIRPDRQLQSAVEVMMLIKQGDKIITFDKYNLRSPLSTIVQNMIDVRRFGLPEGEYNIEVTFTDLNNAKNTAVRTKNITVAAHKTQLFQSDIVLLRTFYKDSSQQTLNKNGFYMEPLPVCFYDKTTDKLQLYNELYNVKEDVAVTYHINQVLNGRESPTNIIGHKKVKPVQEITPLLLQLDISSLPSGYYTLSVDVRNRAKELLSQKNIPFNRSNPYLNIASQDNVTEDALNKEFVAQLDSFKLRYALKAISCKMRGDEGSLLNLLIKNNQTQAQRRFLFKYWAAKNPNNPELAYTNYMEIAAAIDKMFNTGFGYGFETDRGYVYLKYGRPDDMQTFENDAVAPPYEVWQYNDFELTRQKNVKFLFYNQTLVANDFRLLHSNARGEINNPRWKTVLYGGAKDQQIGNSIDGTEMQDNFGRNASRVLEDF